MFVLENPVTEEQAEDHHTDEHHEPLVIAESMKKIRTLTPGMAALELGLADSGVVVFHNVRHGGINVVFKRADGNIGWIDPKNG